MGALDSFSTSSHISFCYSNLSGLLSSCFSCSGGVFCSAIVFDEFLCVHNFTHDVFEPIFMWINRELSLTFLHLFCGEKTFIPRVCASATQWLVTYSLTFCVQDSHEKTMMMGQVYKVGHYWINLQGTGIAWIWINNCKYTLQISTGTEGRTRNLWVTGWPLYPPGYAAPWHFWNCSLVGLFNLTRSVLEIMRIYISMKKTEGTCNTLSSSISTSLYYWAQCAALSLFPGLVKFPGMCRA